MEKPDNYSRVVSHHKLGFGGKTTVPSWLFLRKKADRPPAKESSLGEALARLHGRPPFIHDDLSPPTPYHEGQACAGAVLGANYSNCTKASIWSDTARVNNANKATYSVLRGIVTASLPPDLKPILYPQRLTHAMALQLDKKEMAVIATPKSPK